MFMFMDRRPLHAPHSNDSFSFNVAANAID